LIGVLGFGAEAGSWYVTQRHAQNAADAAAYSGALRLACTSTSCPTETQSVSYRGKEFAAQNGFCNTNDTSYPDSHCPSLQTGTSQTVAIATGAYSAGAFTTPPPSGSGNAVRAQVSQQQPAYLLKILGLSTVTIGTHAIALVNTLPKAPCVLSLTGSISFQGSPNINAGGCGLASNDTANNAINFTGGGMTLSPGIQLSAAGGCTGSATFCGSALTYQVPITNPFANLNSDLTTLCGANPTLPTTCGLSTNGACNSSSLVAYTTAAPCTNNSFKTTGNTAITLNPGVYFISGTLTLTGGSSITGSGVTFVLLPGATIDTKGGGTLTIRGPTSAPATSSLPAAFQSDASLFKYMALYDASSSAVQFGGTASAFLAFQPVSQHCRLCHQPSEIKAIFPQTISGCLFTSQASARRY
jgi:hypothetical protein